MITNAGGAFVVTALLTGGKPVNAFRVARAPEPTLNASKLPTNQPMAAWMPVAVLVVVAVTAVGVRVAQGDLIRPQMPPVPGPVRVPMLLVSVTVAVRGPMRRVMCGVAVRAAVGSGVLTAVLLTMFATVLTTVLAMILVRCRTVVATPATIGKGGGAGTQADGGCSEGEYGNQALHDATPRDGDCRMRRWP